MASNASRPGFLTGFRAVFSGLGFVLARPRSWPWAAVPTLVLTTLVVALVWASVALVQPAVRGWLGSDAEIGGLVAFGSELVAWLAALLSALAGVLLALAVTPPLSSPALEKIVGLQEHELDVPEREPLGLWAEVWCGLRAQAFAALFALPILVVLWLAELVFPAAAVVTVPLGFVVVSLSMAWNLFDYPLTLRNVRMRDRFTLVRAHPRVCLGFGMAFALLFWIPGCGVLLLPIGVAAATRLLWTLLRASPDLLPALRRDRSQSPADGAA